MEFILIIIFVLMIFKPTFNYSKNRGNSSNTFADEETDFDPADTFYLEEGLDHETDDDGYCEECDNYHDA